MRAKPYPEYKPSGVAWLGDVPAHWELKRLRYSVKRREIKVEADENEALPFIGLENIESWAGRLLDLDFDLVPSGVANVFKSGDVLFGKLRPYLAKACIPDFDGLCTTELLVLEQDTLIRKYLLYVLLTTGFVFEVDSSTYGSKMPRANWEIIGNCLVSIPSLLEQQAIAGFLDRETTRLDALIGKKRKLIEALQEKRSALISRTVTRGLPPADALAAGLDPHPPLKPSGIDWLGEVPAHWQIMQLKWAITLQRGHDLTTEERVDGPVPVVTSSGVSGTHNIAVAKGPGIVTGRYGTIGEFYLVNEDYWPINTTLYSIDLHGNDARFLRYMLTHLAPLFLLNAVKSAVPGVDRNDLHPTPTATPPVQEQKVIADFLDEETAKIDKMIATVEAAIEKLQEYRAALITAAVTGKIDVRESKSY